MHYTSPKISLSMKLLLLCLALESVAKKKFCSCKPKCILSIKPLVQVASAPESESD